MSGLPGIFVDILGPVLVLVLIGVSAGKWLELQPEPLAKLSFWVLGPAFMFDALADAGLPSNVLIEVAAASLLALVASGLFALLVSARLTRDRRAAVLTTTIYGNTGNFGLAIVSFTFGDESIPFAAVALVVVNTLGVIVGIASRKGGWAGVGTAFTRPMTLVIVPALLANGYDAELPAIVDRPIGLIAGALIPIMLITLGIQLQQMGMPTFGADVGRSLVGKLVVQPLVAIPVVAAIGLSDVAGGAVILQAAMPAAVFTTVLALEHRTRSDETATIVMVGTLASLMTLPWFILYVT
ncbi:MAG: AEC family transporter [Ilumatobacteraceae bacterium]|nr:AEC family transporter [Ilumatobacteraceae bacterium]